MRHITGLGRTGAGEGTVSDGIPQAHFFSHTHTTWTAFPLQHSLLAQFQTPFSSWHLVCDATMKTECPQEVGHDVFFQDDFSTENILWTMPIFPGNRQVQNE